jgi:hypothetical protein
MILRLCRESLRQRDELDALEELAQARAETEQERLELALELANLVHELAAATPRAPVPTDDRKKKARLYLGPLRAAPRRWP